MNITEETRMTSGTITLAGKQRKYTFVLNPKRLKNNLGFVEQSGWTVLAVIYSQQGTIVDSFETDFVRSGGYAASLVVRLTKRQARNNAHAERYCNV